MMDSITVGAKIRMTEPVTGDYPVGSTATILYIDEMDNVQVVLDIQLIIKKSVSI